MARSSRQVFNDSRVGVLFMSNQNDVALNNEKLRNDFVKIVTKMHSILEHFGNTTDYDITETKDGLLRLTVYNSDSDLYVKELSDIESLADVVQYYEKLLVRGTYVKMTGYQFKTRPERLNTLKKAIKEGETLYNYKGEHLNIPNTKENLDILDSLDVNDVNTINKAVLTLDDGQHEKLKVKDIGKSKAFGGLGLGNLVKRKEASQIAAIQSELDSLIEESGNGYLNVIFNGSRYKIKGLKPVESDSYKADCYLYNNKGEPVIYISLKHGDSAKSFQQYSGVSVKYQPYIGNASITLDFVNRVHKECGGQMVKGLSYTIPITNFKMINTSVYGWRYDGFNKGGNLNCVDCLVQFTDDVSNVFTKEGESYRLNTLFNRGEIPTGLYKCYLLARYDGKQNDMGIKNCRMLIMPMAKIGNAKVLTL